MFQPAFSVRGLALAGLAITTLACLPAVQAATLPTERVYVGDLDVASPKGQRQLQRRVARAIGRVCASPSTSLLASPRVRRDVRTCHSHAWQQVREQLAGAGVTQLVAFDRR